MTPERFEGLRLLFAADVGLTDLQPEARELLAEIDRLRDALKEAKSMLAICQFDEPDADYEAAWYRGLATIDAALGGGSD